MKQLRERVSKLTKQVSALSSHSRTGKHLHNYIATIDVLLFYSNQSGCFQPIYPTHYHHHQTIGNVDNSTATFVINLGIMWETVIRETIKIIWSDIPVCRRTQANSKLWKSGLFQQLHVAIVEKDSWVCGPLFQGKLLH